MPYNYKPYPTPYHFCVSMKFDFSITQLMNRPTCTQTYQSNVGIDLFSLIRRLSTINSKDQFVTMSFYMYALISTCYQRLVLEGGVMHRLTLDLVLLTWDISSSTR
ncbi:hypothetical protein ACOSQ2_013829 [Xanthoceras sorbifolium]